MRKYCCEVSTDKHECLVAEYAATKQEAIAKANTTVASILAEPYTVYTASVYREGMARDGGGYSAIEARGDTPQAAIMSLGDL